MRETPDGILRQWVDALRSGDYKQSKGHLKKTHDGEDFARYCCLGVLCEVVGVEWDDDRSYITAEPVESLVHVAATQTETLHNSDSVDLPTSIVNMVGMQVNEHSTLVRMNDTEEATFQDIADFIEQEYVNPPEETH